jgi:hypothetical protein
LFVLYQIWCREIAKAGIHPPTDRSEHIKILVCMSPNIHLAWWIWYVFLFFFKKKELPKTWIWHECSRSNIASMHRLSGTTMIMSKRNKLNAAIN